MKLRWGTWLVGGRPATQVRIAHTLDRGEVGHVLLHWAAIEYAPDEQCPNLSAAQVGEHVRHMLTWQGRQLLESAWSEDLFADKADIDRWEAWADTMAELSERGK